MKIALIHDYLTQNGGAEKVVLEIARLFPGAPLYTLVYNRSRLGKQFSKIDVRTTFIQRLPWGVSQYQIYLPLMPRAIESINLNDFDVVISSSSSFAKGVITNDRTLHICYCHTPTRYLWGDTHGYVDELRYPWPMRLAARAVLPRLRLWDRLAADRPDLMIANSEEVRKRIKKYYRRDAAVIYPPVEIGEFTYSEKPGKFFLAGGRLVWHKRFDVIIRAFNRNKLPLKIFGEGPVFNRLRRMAKANIEFLSFVEPDVLAKLYTDAIAYIHPQEEDFGLTAVEAMASGRPVIAFNIGGARETVVSGQTGYYIDEQSWEALGDAVIRFQPERYSPRDCRRQAEKFSADTFRVKMRTFIDEAVKSKSDYHASGF